MNRASYQPGLSSERRVLEHTGPASQNELWIICPRCGWPKPTGVAGSLDNVPYGLLGHRRRRCEHCGVLISWSAEFCDTLSAWLRIARLR